MNFVSNHYCSVLQVAALRAIDRERPVFDELVNLVNGPYTLPAAAAPLYSELVSKYMALIGWRYTLTPFLPEPNPIPTPLLTSPHSMQHLLERVYRNHDIVLYVVVCSHPSLFR